MPFDAHKAAPPARVGERCLQLGMGIEEMAGPGQGSAANPVQPPGRHAPDKSVLRSPPNACEAHHIGATTLGGSMNDTSRRKFLAAAAAGAGAVAGTVALPIARAGAARPRGRAQGAGRRVDRGPERGRAGPDGRRARGRRTRSRPRVPDPRRDGSEVTCPPTAKHPRSPRTPWPTAPTSTPSSAPTPGHGHPDRELHPAPEARRRTELLRVRRRRALPDPRLQRRQAGSRRHLSVPLPHRGPQPRRPSSTTPARSPTSPTRRGTVRSTTR